VRGRARHLGALCTALGGPRGRILVRVELEVLAHLAVARRLNDTVPHLKARLLAMLACELEVLLERPVVLERLRGRGPDGTAQSSA